LKGVSEIIPLHLVYLAIPICNGKDPDYIHICTIYIHAILEVVAIGIVQTITNIYRYIKCTLMNFTKLFEDVVKLAQESLEWLCNGKILEQNEPIKLYSTSSLSPKESLVHDCTFYFYYNIFNLLTYCFTMQDLSKHGLSNC
jgi:hypothetical protein